MDSSDLVNQQELLSQVTASYREIFLDYRSVGIGLDSKLWFEDMQVDYVLEVILANFAIVNLICERKMEESILLTDPEDGPNNDEMLDYDMGYQLSEDCNSVIGFAKSQDIEVRSSLIYELLFAHIQYFNLSKTAGRHGWFDVNKRLLNSILSLVDFEPELMDLIEQWRQDVEDFDLEYSSKDEAPAELSWKKEFTDAIVEAE